jgi:tetratricopeptide (TPR) repeat protein
MNTKNVIILVAGVVVVVMAIQSRSRRAEQVPSPGQTGPVSTRSTPRLRLPAPRMPFAPASVPEAQPSGLEHTNVFARMLKEDGELPKLSRDQVESYLAENRRSAESLLAAFRLAGDRSLLQEAAEKYPNDPSVNYAGWIAARMKDDASPEERRQWLEAFKQSAPDNALANYLSAQDCFQSGRTDRAVEELMAAAAKSKFQDYSADCAQNLEEAYLSAGYSETEAKAAGAYSVWLPNLSDLKELGHSVGELAKLYRQAGDEASAQAALQMGVTLGQRLTEPAGQRPLIYDFSGLALERRILETLDPASPYDAAGHSVNDRLDELRQQVEANKALWKQADPVLQNMSDQELTRYFDRMKTFGETEALRWVMSRHGNR